MKINKAISAQTFIGKALLNYKQSYDRKGKLQLVKLVAATLLGSFMVAPVIAQPEEMNGNNLNLDKKNLIRVVDVEIVGNNRIDGSAIKLQLKSSSGFVTSEQISNDVKTVYQTGFFDQVSVSRRPTSSGVVLVYTVVEKPAVRKVFVKGNKAVSDTDLADIFRFDTSRFLDKRRLVALEKSGETYYQGRGFYDADVSFTVLPVGNNQVDVTFTISEGQKYSIDQIEFRGLQEIDANELRDTIETKRYKWWNSWLFGTGRVNEALLESDRSRIRQYLFDNGYIDGTVSEPSIEKSGDGELRVYFVVSEGKQYRVGAIGVSGDLIEKSAEKTLKGISLEGGDIFNASAVRQDAFSITDKFGDIGYAYANVVPNTLIDRDRRLVKVEYEVSKGKKVKVRRVKIQGNTKTYDNVIRREVRLREQDEYSSKKVRRSEEVLRRLGFFEEVSVANEPTQKEDEIDLLVNVREASTGSFSFGAGYSSFDGALFNARVSENNLFGSGRRVDLNADLGAFRNDIILSFNDPRIADSFVRGGINAVHSRRNFFDFDRQQSGGGLVLGYPLEQIFGASFQDVQSTLQYDLYRNEILNVNPENAAPLVVASQGVTTSSAFTPGLVRNKIDNPLNPENGSRQDISVELAGAGGDQKYYLAEASQQWYEPLADTSLGRFVFSWRTRVGYGDTFNNEVFPLFRRFFPGGINSVRGFRNRSMGPKDEQGNEFGGSSQFINNLEMIFPLINSAGLKGVVFYDIGNAFDDGQGIEFSELREAYGAGVRWSSPLGPIRLEFGFPVDRQRGERAFQTQFSFGAPL
jgi:outer membrane protein insertion porin family